MLAHRQKVPDGFGTAKALDYSLKRWAALTRYLDDGAVPIDSNWVENPFLCAVLDYVQLHRRPTQKNNAIDELLPHNWKLAIPDKV